jgi:nucleotide-binding universal stress UspA family protein
VFPLKKILCPTDFSEPSYVALVAANELAQRFSAEIILVHGIRTIDIMPATTGSVYTPPIINIEEYLQDVEEQAKQTLEEVVEKKIPKNITVRPVVFQGDPAIGIIDLANDEKAGMIVIATHGRRGWRRVIFGSVAEKVVRLAPCPVLVIHEPRKN